MAIGPSDISLVLSGGSLNMEPDKSLGGDPSSQPITGVLNNLFSDVAPTGLIEQYRCFYMFNDHLTDSFYNVSLEITSEVEGGSTVEMGLRFANEAQLVRVSGSPTGGTGVVLYEGNPISFAGDADPGAMGDNLAAALNESGLVSGVSVVGVSQDEEGGEPSTDLTVFFLGSSSSRSHDLLTVQSGAFTGATAMTVTRVTGGSPVNSIPDDLDVDLTPPAGVTFVGPLVAVELGTLRAGDGVPIWIKRTTSPGIPALDLDGFSLTITVTPFA